MTFTFSRSFHFLLAGVALSAAFGLASFAHAEEASSQPGAHMTVANSGQVIVRGAKVTGVSGGVITATTQWGSSSLSWTVRTNGSTRFLPAGAVSTDTLRAIKIGDTVSFSGELDMSAGRFIVGASVFKDVSLIRDAQVIRGAVQGVSKAPDTLTVSGEQGTSTIAVTRNTILTRKNFHRLSKI